MSATTRPALGDERRSAGEGWAAEVDMTPCSTAGRPPPSGASAHLVAENYVAGVTRPACQDRGDVVGPGADCLGVSRVGLGHVVEGEVQLVGVHDATEDGDRHRLDVRHLGQRVVDLLAGPLDRLLLEVHGSHPEDEDGALAELLAHAVQQPAGVAVPVAHVERAADDQGVVGRHVIDGRGRPDVDVEPVVAQGLRHLLGDLLGRSVLGRVRDEGLVFHAADRMDGRGRAHPCETADFRGRTADSH